MIDQTAVRAADYHDLVRVRDPALAPDGSRLAYVRERPADDESYEATIHVVDTDGDGEPRRFTAAAGVDGEPRWSPSGDRLAFVSTRGDDDRPQAWVLPTTGGEARQVTDVPAGVSDVAWSPDGSRLAFVATATADERETGVDVDVHAGDGDDPYEREPPDPKVIDRLVYRAGTTYHDGARSHVYLVTLGGDGGDGDAVVRVTDGDYDHATPAWGDASTLYCSAKRTGDDPDDNAEIDLLAADVGDDGVSTPERVGGTTGWGTALSATADGRLAHRRTPQPASMRQAEVDVLDVATGETRTLTDGIDRTVAADAGIEWGPDDRAIHFLTPDEGRVVLRRARDPAADADGDGTDAAGDGGVSVVVDRGHATGFSVAHPSAADAVDGGARLYATVASEWDHPGDAFVRRLGDDVDGPTRLTDANAAYLADRRVGEPEPIAVESDGHEVRGWVLTPPGYDEGADDVPVVLEIHGGPHAMWSTSGTMWHEFQTLAARGYVVVWANPRGSTGYGEAFATAIEADWGAVTSRDLLAVFESACERPGVDASNAFVTGGSFGGFATAWLIGHDDRFRAAAPQRGVYDLSAFYGVTDAFKLVEWDFGTTPTEDAAFLRDQSPIATADDVATPTLVIHAARDFRVPVSDGEAFYRALSKAGVETRLVRYPREGHELSRSGEPAHVVDRIERIARWFDGYSDHHDAPPAVERGDDGLSTAADADDGDGGRDA